MKKLMIVSAALVAVTAQAGWGDLGKAAAKDATAATLKGLSGASSDSAKRTNARCEEKKCNDAELAEKAKKDEISKKQLAEKSSVDAKVANVYSYMGKKYDWKYKGDWSTTEYHTRIASGKEIERPEEYGAYQIQQFHDDNYGFSHVGFWTLEDLEYAVAQLDAYVTKCVGWQKIAIENNVDGMCKKDEKTKFNINKEGTRNEEFWFFTKKNKAGQIVGSFSARCSDKHDNFLGGFNNVENDGCVEFWQKQVEAFKKAIELYKTGVQEDKEKKDRVKNAESLFN